MVQCPAPSGNLYFTFRYHMNVPTNTHYQVSLPNNLSILGKMCHSKVIVYEACKHEAAGEYGLCDRVSNEGYPPCEDIAVMTVESEPGQSCRECEEDARLLEEAILKIAEDQALAPVERSRSDNNGDPNLRSYFGGCGHFMFTAGDRMAGEQEWQTITDDYNVCSNCMEAGPVLCEEMRLAGNFEHDPWGEFSGGTVEPEETEEPSVSNGEASDPVQVPPH